MRKILLAAAALVLAMPAAAIPPLPSPPSPQPQPKLLIVIAIDQFSADLFDQYRPQFTAGLARLASGTVFRNGYQSHATTDTCAGHSTMLTGDRPSRTGIVANSWIDQSVSRADKRVNCAEDESVPDSTSSKYTVSARHLLVPTLGELMKAQWPQSRTVAVAGKDRAAVMMSGRRPDQRWYWTGRRFETDLANAPVPTVVPKVNAGAAAGLARARPGLEPTPFCSGKAAPIALSGGRTVGAGRLGRAAGDAEGFEASTELDGDTLALALGLVDELRLGRNATPDVLTIGLSATDHVGHRYGTEGQEMCLQMMELDREIGDFLAVLDSRGIDYEVALTADHGGKDLPERERVAGNPNARRVTAGLVRPEGLLGGHEGDVYVNRNLSPALQQKALVDGVAALRANPQVEAVFTSSEIAATAPPAASPDRWSLIERARASYHPGLSGDLYVVLKKDVTPIANPTGTVGTHGGPWDYDRRVPILFWRPGLSGSTIEQPIETVDIMPTLAAQLGLVLPAGSVDGHCLPQAAGCIATPSR